MRLLLIPVFCLPLLQGGVVLTFDQAAGGPSVDQAYGDNVSTNPQGGNSYGTVANGFGFTPNITVTYGAPGEALNIFGSDYGDLTNVAYNENDGDTSLTITFDAAGGFNVILFGFDLGGWNRTDYTLQNISVFDGGAATLFSQNNVAVNGAAGHSSISFGAGLQASTLRLVLDLSGLGSSSDNIGIDNIHFGQVSVTSTPPAPSGVPEPASFLLIGAGLLAIAYKRRK
ncbi:MAG: PEP-CTERM sorting domain-containing protein [Bryobacteraceae bacterium]